jgi:hypothetical protein
MQRGYYTQLRVVALSQYIARPAVCSIGDQLLTPDISWNTSLCAF